MAGRVYGEKVSIDTKGTVSFYDQRAKTIKNREQEYTTVLLGDQDPDYAVKWDEYEKGFILPKLELNRNKVILDLGCGMGRMADAVSDQCKEYYCRCKTEQRKQKLPFLYHVYCGRPFQSSNHNSSV